METITGLACAAFAGALVFGASVAFGLPDVVRFPVCLIALGYGYLAGRASHAQRP